MNNYTVKQLQTLKATLLGILENLHDACIEEKANEAAREIHTIILELKRPATLTIKGLKSRANHAYESLNQKALKINQSTNENFVNATFSLIEFLSSLDEIEIEETKQISTEDANALRRLFNKQSEEINRNTADMLNKLNHLESSFSEKRESVEEAAKNAAEEINALLQNTKAYVAEQSNNAIYKDYKSSANSERILSDRFRLYSAATMALAALAATFTIAQALKDISASQIIFRITLSIILGVMAAYFARESGKHRRQQYLYQQFSLNLNALPLFIADLEPTTKNNLKSDLARIIFTTPHESKTEIDPYPLDIQEVMLALIDKLPEKGK